MQTTKAPKLKTKRSKISYAKWGYVFIAPFFLAYALFHFAPQLLTIYNSFFENYREGLTQVGPNFVGLKNYITLFTPDKNGTIDILKYAGKYHCALGRRRDPAGRDLPDAGVLLYKLPAEDQGPAVFQDRDLYAEPHHGVGVRDAVLYAVFECRSDQPDPDAARLDRHADRLLQHPLHRARAHLPDELPHVVRQHDNFAHGRHHGH